MKSGGRRRSLVFIALGAAGVGCAIALNVGWIIVNWREAGLLVAGLLLFPLIIAGVVLNTIFLVREIRRNEQHETFINAVTHELKTPIASVKLHLQTLQNRPVEEAKRREFYQLMVEDCDRLLNTVEQVLRAGRLRARMRRASFRRVDLATIVSESLALARARYRLPPEALTYRESLTNGERPFVLGDEEDLKAVFSNLVDNAIKYSGSSIQVDVELEQVEPARATVRVRDRGIGIPRTERKQIFKRFYRIQDAMANRIKGAGLGLFIVRAVVARHGGKVSAESDGPGHGSTFIVRLPLVATR